MWHQVGPSLQGLSARRTHTGQFLSPQGPRAELAEDMGTVDPARRVCEGRLQPVSALPPKQRGLPSPTDRTFPLLIQPGFCSEAHCPANTPMVGSMRLNSELSSCRKPSERTSLLGCAPSAPGHTPTRVLRALRPVCSDFYTVLQAFLISLCHKHHSDSTAFVTPRSSYCAWHTRGASLSVC